MKLVFMRASNMVFLLAIAVLVSLGAATQMADAYTNSGTAHTNDATTASGTTNLYSNSGNFHIQFHFFGDRTSSNSNDWPAAFRHGGLPSNSEIVVTNPSGNAVATSGTQDYSTSTSFYFQYKIENLDDGITTVTFPAGKIGPSTESDRNAAVTFTFIYDATKPTFVGSPDFSTVQLSVGDPTPTPPTPTCSDANLVSSTPGTHGEDEIDTSTVGDYRVTYRCHDNANNSFREVKLYQVSDNTAPVLVHTGSSTTTVDQFAPAFLPRMLCSDNVDGISFISSPVILSTTHPSTSVINYQCSDAAGNDSNIISYTVTVTESFSPTLPTTVLRAENGADATQSISLELTGKHPIYLAQGATYNAPTLSCIDNTTGSDVRSTPTLLSSSDTVDNVTLGDYTQHYSCTGTQGTNNYDVVVSVFETPKIHKMESGGDVLELDHAGSVPTVSYSGLPLTMTFHGYASIESVISLYDDTTSRLSPVMTTVLATANLDVGHLEYVFSPTSGANPHVSIGVDGFPSPDDDYLLAHDSGIESPVLTFNGDAVVSIPRFSTFTDPGASCTDNLDTLTPQVFGSVDTDTVGLYNLSYVCVDEDQLSDTAYRSAYVTPVDTMDVTITPIYNDVTKLDSNIFKVVFQYPVSGFTVDDVSMTGGTVTDVTSGVPGIYTIATDSFVEGPVTLTITGGAATGVATSKVNEPASYDFIYDATAPVFPSHTPSDQDVHLGHTFVPYDYLTCDDANGTVDAVVYANNVDTSRKTLGGHLGTFDTVAYQCTDAAGNVSDLHFVDVHVRASNPNPGDVRTPITVELTPHSNGVPGNGVINDFVGTDRIVFLAEFSEPVSGFTVEDVLSSYRDAAFLAELCIPYYIDCYDNTDRNVNVISVEESTFYRDHTRYFITVDPIGTRNMFVQVGSSTVSGIANPDDGNQNSTAILFSRDTIAPVYNATVANLDGTPKSLTILKGSESFDPNIACTDLAILSNDVRSGSVDTSTSGTYTLTYRCEDIAGKVATTSVDYTVVDPTITAVISHDTHTSSSLNTNQRDITFNVAFSEAVSGFDHNDFLLNDDVSIRSVSHANTASPDNINYVVVVISDIITGNAYVSVAANSVSAHGSSNSPDFNHPSNTFIFTSNSADPVFEEPKYPDIKQHYPFVHSVTCHDALGIDAGTITHGTVETSTRGALAVVLTCTDVFGNTAEKSVAYNVVFDSAPVITTAGGTIADNTVVVNGTAVPGATVELFNNGEGASTCVDGTVRDGEYICNPYPVTANADGDWSTRIYLGYWTGNNNISAHAIINTVYSQPSNVVTFEHGLPRITGFTQSGISDSIEPTQRTQIIPIVSLKPITLDGLIPSIDQHVGVYLKHFVADDDLNLGFVTDNEDGFWDFAFTPKFGDNFVQIASFELTADGDREDVYFNLGPSYVNFQYLGGTELTPILIEKLGITGIPFLVTSDVGAATSANTRVTIPSLGGTDEAITSIQFSNYDNYQVSRANNAPALVILAGADVSDAVMDTDGNKIEFIEGVSTWSITAGNLCPCDVQIQIDTNSDAVDGIVDNLKIFHFTDGQWQTLDTTISGNVLSASVKSLGALAVGLTTSIIIADPIDTRSPVITPAGSSETVELESTNSYSELGGTVNDDDSSYSGTVTVTGDAPDTSAVGVYTVLYDAPDDATGNSAAQQSIVITVEDTTPPTFDVNGNASDFATAILFNGMYTPGVIANQFDISGIASSVIGGNSVDAASDGTYHVTYTVTDNSGLTKTITETVTVSPDGTPGGTPILPPLILTHPVPSFTSQPTVVLASPITLIGTSLADSTVKLFKGLSSVNTVTTDSSGIFEFTGVVLTEGLNSFTITASDGTSTSAASAPLVVTLDTPLVDSTIATTPIITTTSATVSASTITIEGTADASNTILLFNNGKLTSFGFADGSGDFVFANISLDSGANSFTVQAYASGKSHSDISNAVVITFDAPLQTLRSTHSESSTDAVTTPVITTTPETVSTSTITIEGTADAGSSVFLYNNGDFVPGKVAFTDGSGDFVFANISLDSGANSFTVQAGISGKSPSDLSHPVVITFNSASSTDTVSTPIITTTSATVTTSTITIDGTADVGSSVLLLNNGKFVTLVFTDGSGDFTFTNVPLSTGANSFTVQAGIFGKTNSDISDAVVITTPLGTKNSGSSDNWHMKPTFGISHLTHKQIVDNGFSFNGYSLTVTDNWHTDFHLTSSLIGETNTVKIKTYSADPLKWINLYLGVPRLGDVSDAESEIQLVVSRDYNNPVDYTIDEINHYQAEELVNVDDTTASLQKIKCQASDNDIKCYEFTINFTVMAPLHEEVVAISAMDDKRGQHVTYINEGVEFTGTSLLDAHTAQLMQKKTNQGQAEIIELTQQDRRYNVWEDQHGYLWTLNEYGTWTQITAADFERHQDDISSVMTRQNSNFASLIEQERQKALLVFDSSELISELDDYFAYDYSNVDSDMSKLDKYAYELQLESERAQKYTRQN